MMWLGFDWNPLWLTCKLATVTTIILVIVGIPLAHYLAFSRARMKPAFEALVSMPLVLPPSVLGFYLLLALSPQSGLGLWLNENFDIQLVFSFTGLVIGSVIFSLPFMVQPLQAGLQSLPFALIEASRTLGKSDVQTLIRILLPNIKGAMLTGIVLSFAHTVGEFGVVLMIGGKVPGISRVASIAIYDEVESMHYREAHFYSLILVLFSFLVLLAVYWGRRRFSSVVVR